MGGHLRHVLGPGGTPGGTGRQMSGGKSAHRPGAVHPELVAQDRQCRGCAQPPPRHLHPHLQPVPGGDGLSCQAGQKQGAAQAACVSQEYAYLRMERSFGQGCVFCFTSRPGPLQSPQSCCMHERRMFLLMAVTPCRQPSSASSCSPCVAGTADLFIVIKDLAGVFSSAAAQLELKSQGTRPAEPGFKFGDRYQAAIDEVGLPKLQSADVSKILEPQRSACQLIQLSDAMRTDDLPYSLLLTNQVRHAASGGLQ